MDQRLVVLKLFLDELGVSDSIDTVDDRKRVQKAIYLGQLSGLDLGYRFGWYLKGPYSTDLTKDYYSLAEAIASGDMDYAGKSLPEPLRARLQEVKPLMTVPDEIGLAQEDWLELVSSLHYLRKIQGRDREKALETLRRGKPRLVPFADRAEEKLVQVGLL
jgi:uncharacterized protein YwgA